MTEDGELEMDCGNGHTKLQGYPCEECTKTTPAPQASEVRTWWITQYPNNEQLVFDRPCHPDLRHLIKEETHVIEHAAYLRLGAELEQVKLDFSDARNTARHHSAELTYRGKMIDELVAQANAAEVRVGELKELVDELGAERDQLQNKVDRKSKEIELAREQLSSLLKKTKMIKLANKEMTRNDHVRFGELLTENRELKERVADLSAELTLLETQYYFLIDGIDGNE